LGFLFGVLSGLMTWLFLSDTCKEPQPRWPWLQKFLGPKLPPSGFKVSAKLSGLPVLWFGGSWLTSYMTRSIDYWMADYIASLAFSYCLIMLPSIVRIATAYCARKPNS
jgi:hypothetical protein